MDPARCHIYQKTIVALLAFFLSLFSPVFFFFFFFNLWYGLFVVMYYWFSGCTILVLLEKKTSYLYID